MKTIIKNLFLLALVASPYMYLYFIWQQLPDRVPIHFNFEGVADNWSGKNFLLFLPTGLGAFIYLLMLALPYIDPKKKIQQMGEKYTSLHFALTVFFSLLSFYLLYVTKEGSVKNLSVLFAIIGAMLALLGNYFQTVRPNYFIGVRTPWTLENENVWKKTHHMAGRLWMVSGILIAILSFVISNNFALVIVFTSLIAVMALVPIVFSYIEYRKEKKAINQ